jgi:hypothetical protein
MIVESWEHREASDGQGDGSCYLGRPLGGDQRDQRYPRSPCQRLGGGAARRRGSNGDDLCWHDLPCADCLVATDRREDIDRASSTVPVNNEIANADLPTQLGADLPNPMKRAPRARDRAAAVVGISGRAMAGQSASEKTSCLPSGRDLHAY